MLLTKFGHACVTLDKGEGRLVVDPGELTPQDVTPGAHAILVTHGHPDHFSEQKLRAALAADPSLRIFAHASVAERLTGLAGSVVVVADGDRFTTAGFDVEVHGAWHATVHRDLARIPNVGFLLDGELLAPGDALMLPARRVRTVLAPVHAPWSRTADVIDWLRELAPAHAVRVHDGGLSEWGLRTVDNLLGDGGPGTGCRYVRLAVGESFETDEPGVAQGRPPPTVGQV